MTRTSAWACATRCALATTLISVLVTLAFNGTALAAATAATEQEAIATQRVQPPRIVSREAAPDAPAPKPTQAPMTTNEQINAFRASPSTPWQDADNLDALSDAPVRQIHGETGVAVGTGRFRSGYVQSDIPVGRNGTLSLFVQETQGQGHGYGYGYGDSFGYGDRTGRSLGFSLDLSAPGKRSACRPTSGDRTLQRGETSGRCASAGQRRLDGY